MFGGGEAWEFGREAFLLFLPLDETLSKQAVENVSVATWTFFKCGFFVFTVHCWYVV